MELKHIPKGENGIVLSLDDDIQIGEITYASQGDGQIVIDHTEVEPSARGRGVGKTLVEEVVSIARAEGWKIIPQCPFAAAEFDQNESYADVRA